MSGRSHRHSVPTARRPAQAQGVVYLWGRGDIGSDLRAYLHDEHARIAEHDDVARRLAADHGCPIDIVPDAWAWRLEHVNARIIDAMTRDDRHVFGWTEFPREICPPSLALRNALNALTADEITRASGVLAQRFGKAGHAHADEDPNRWIASDNRTIFFDAEAREWRLGDYAGA